MSKQQKEKSYVNDAGQGFEYHRERSSKSAMRNSRSHSEFSNLLPKTSESNIRRKAIDLIGRVGHQYDASQDKIVNTFRLLESPSSKISTDILPTCLFIKGESLNSDILLKVLEIDDESILNVLFNTTSIFTDGTQMSIFNCQQWTGSRRRILFYRRICEKESVTMKSKWNALQKSPLHQNATHIITSISYGLEFLIIFEVPIELSMHDVDKQLHRLCMILRTGRKLSINDTLLHYFDQLKILALYSNVSKLTLLKNMSSVYDRICKFNMQNAQPIFYYLHLISSIYHQVNIFYRQINYEILYSVQSEFISFRCLLEEVNCLLRKSCQKSKYNQQYEDIRQRYYHIQQLLMILICDIHQGKKNEHELGEYFIQNDFYSLVAETEKFLEHIRSLTSSDNRSDSLNMTDINVLLLGETGVGKSTFINALANFLRFQSLPAVEESEPTVLIPTSFLVTMRTLKRTTKPHLTDFQEKLIQFGKPDPNEYHNDQGQSVTQQCRSYSISINQQIHLNLIDTPGIGDTRGMKQDEINIENISSFIQNLSHLNAICILLKPNVERLHTSFRLYLNQLFQLLHSDVRKNILFCFTNARSTLYMPGNTLPLLEDMLKQLPGERILLTNANTFCFDSESFRYLAASKQGMKFTEKQDREYQQSWTKSAGETDRFYQYIRSLKPCSIQESEPTSCIF